MRSLLTLSIHCVSCAHSPAAAALHFFISRKWNLMQFYRIRCLYIISRAPHIGSSAFCQRHCAERSHHTFESGFWGDVRSMQRLHRIPSHFHRSALDTQWICFIICYLTLVSYALCSIKMHRLSLRSCCANLCLLSTGAVVASVSAQPWQLFRFSLRKLRTFCSHGDLILCKRHSL